MESRVVLVLGTLVACGSAGEGPTDEIESPSTTWTPYTEATGLAPCDVQSGLEVLSVETSQPWNANEAELQVSLTGPSSIAVVCRANGDEEEVHLLESADAAAEHNLRMAGLLADTTYWCEAAAVCPASDAPSAVFELRTKSPTDSGLPGFSVDVETARRGSDYVLLDHLRADGQSTDLRVVIVDRDGNVRWHGNGLGGQAATLSPVEPSIVMAGAWPPNPEGRPHRFSLFGSEVMFDAAEVLDDVSTTLFHHDGRHLPDGRYATLEERLDQNPDGSTFRGFAVRILDPLTGTIDFDYSSQRSLDEGHLAGGEGDVYHANWMDIVEIDGQTVLHLSLCDDRKVVAIDVPSGDWRWTFGAGGDFTLVDTEGRPLGDEDYPQCQHGLQRRGDRLLVYDNGHDRGQSRASEYRLDEATMTATLLWTWTEDGWFERILGGVDWTVRDQVTIGIMQIFTQDFVPDFSRVVEIDPETGTTLWQMRFKALQDFGYKHDMIGPCAVFGNARFCPLVDERLEVLAPVLSGP